MIKIKSNAVAGTVLVKSEKGKAVVARAQKSTEAAIVYSDRSPVIIFQEPEGDYAAAVHNHAIADVTGLQTALDGKQAAGSYAAASHNHAIAEVTGLQTALDAKAASSHNHAIAEVTGLQTALDAKAASSHNHAIAEVTGLQSALDAKAAASHNHAIADVTGLQTALDAKAAASHNHAIADVTGLQTALDGKQAAGSYAAAGHGHDIDDVTGLQTALDSKATALADLSLWDYWAETNFMHITAGLGNLLGAAISSGTNNTAIPVGSLNGKFPNGVFLRSSTTINGGYRYQGTSLVSDYFGQASHKFRGILNNQTSFVGRLIRLGYHDSTTGTDAADGAYFEINAGVVSAKCANNSVRTTNVTTIALSLNTVYAFDIDVNPAGTEARFRVYNASTGELLMDVTNTTNIPVTSARAFGVGIVATESSITASDICILYYIGFGTIEAFNKRIK